MNRLILFGETPVGHAQAEQKRKCRGIEIRIFLLRDALSAKGFRNERNFNRTDTDVAETETDHFGIEVSELGKRFLNRLRD